MSEIQKINLNQSLIGLKDFFKKLVPKKSKLLLKSETDSDMNNVEVIFRTYKDVNNLVILEVLGEEKIIMRFNLDKPETFNNITSLEILSNPEIEDSSSPAKDESVTIETQEQKVSIIEDADESQMKSETEDDAEELEADIVIDDIEEEELTIFQEATIWELSYKSNTLIEDIVSHLQDYYNRKNKDKDINLIYREANEILDLINKFKESTDVTDKKTVKHSGNFRPLLNNIISKDFLPSYISPVVFDQKKFYTKNETYLDSDVQDELELKNDIVFVDENEELEILNEINKQYRNKKNTSSEFKDYTKILEKLYQGGQISLKDDDEEDRNVSFEPINRSHTNNIPNDSDNISYFKTELKHNTKVIRSCFTDGGCTVNPDEVDDEIEKKITVSTRLADGEIIVIKDSYDDRFMHETKGEIKSCSSIGDRFYTGADKTSDLNKTISKPPKHVKYIEGENVNIVGFYIKAINYFKPEIINGKEIVQNDGYKKIYPKLHNEGFTLQDSSAEKHSKLIKIINNYEDFSWDLYNPNYNYVIFFNTTKTRTQLSNDEYNEVVRHITPTIDDIMNIEIDKINNCVNMEDLHRILNKHNIHPRQISTEVLVRYDITNKFINNGEMIRNYEEYLKNKIIITRDRSEKYVKLHNTLIQFKSTIENDLKINGYTPTDDKYFSDLKESIEAISEPIFNLYNDAFLISFVENYLNIKSNLSDRKLIIELIITRLVISSDSVYSESEITKYFTNPEELIDLRFQGLFNKFIMEYNIPVNPFADSHINHFDKNILKHLDFIKNMRNDGNNSQEVIEIINLNNLVKIDNNINKVLNDYGEKSYNNIKEPEALPWNNLSVSEKNDYIPNYDTASTLRDKARIIKTTYEQQKTTMEQYMKACKNIRIMKIYNSIEELIKDNNRTIFTSPKFDTTVNDLKIAHSIKKDVTISDFEQEFEKTMFSIYIYETEEIIRSKISTVLNIIADDSLEKKRKIKPGDYCFIKDGRRKLLYVRRGTSWIPVDSSYGSIDKCFNYEKNLLTIEFDDIMKHCLNYKEGDETKCIHTKENDIIINKLYQLSFLHKSILNKVSNIINALEYKKSIKEKINGHESNLKKRLEVLISQNKRKLNYDIKEPEQIEHTKKTYPPKSILSKFQTIQRIEDFDQRNLKLKDFISEYGVQYKTINGNMLSNNYWWYNIPNVNIPIVCIHHDKLMDSALRDNETKEKNMQEVIDKFGVLDGEFYYCKICGEVIGYQRYSEFEGFGRDDKVINVREAVIEDEEDEDIIDDIANIPVSDVRRIVNTILRKINVDLRVSDYKQTLELVSNRIDRHSSELTNLKSFYYNYIKGVGLDSNKQANENKIINAFEELPGSEYSISFFNKISSITQDKKILGFVNRFYKIRERKQGTILKLHRGFRTLHTLAYSIAALTEIIRTAMPDYTIKGSGVEKREKKGRNASGIIINDIFDSKIKVDGKDKLWMLAYLTDNMLEDITKKSSNDMKAVLAILQQMEKKESSQTKKELYSIFLEEKYQEVSEMGMMRDKVKDKQRYQIETYIEKDTEITYDWNEFLPNLGFNNVFTYTAPNIDSIIENQKLSIIKLKELNRKFKISLEEEQPNIKNEILSLTSRIQDNNQELRNIENKIGYNLVTKINNIITEEQLPDNFNPSVYSTSSNYDNIKSEYLNDYIEKDSTIINVKKDLYKINEYFTKYNYNNSIIYDILITTLSPRDLQHFMNIEPELYQSDTELIKKALINKIKQSNYIYNLNKGDNYGELRYFKTVTDNDYYIVTKLQEQEVLPEVFKEKLREELITKYGENYSNLDMKIKLLIDFNGTAEIDVVSLEFKSDVSDSIDKLTLGKNIDEINQIITDIEVNTNDIQKDTNLPYLKINPEINNKDIVSDRLRDMLTIYSSTCLDESSIDETIESLISIQKNIYTTQLKNVDTYEYRSKKTEIIDKLKDYFNICTEDLSNKIVEISNVVGGNSAIILTDMINLDNYYNELKDAIESRLKIEDITNPDIKSYEKQFRENRYNILKFSNRINTHISLIRYLLNTLSRFHYKINGNNVKEEIIPIFLQSDDKESIKKIHENAGNINNSIFIAIEDIKARGLDTELYNMPAEQFRKINILIDKLTMFGNTTDSQGNIDLLFVNTPEVMVGLTNNIIIYLINLLIFESEPQQTQPLIPIINNIMSYIKNISMANNITDKSIKTIMDKHRADENQARLKRFSKKDDEEKSLHNIYRKYNLGKQIVDDTEMVVDQSEVGFLSMEEEQHSPIIQNEDGTDNFEEEEDMNYEQEIDNIPISDNLLEDDIEEREEYE